MRTTNLSVPLKVSSLVHNILLEKPAQILHMSLHYVLIAYISQVNLISVSILEYIIEIIYDFWRKALFDHIHVQ